MDDMDDMDLISAIRTEIETRTGNFEPEVFKRAFAVASGMIMDNDDSTFGETFDISQGNSGGNRTRNRHRKKRKTLKGGVKSNYVIMLIICLVTIIAFCTEAARADKIILVLVKKRDSVMTHIIIPFIAYLSEIMKVDDYEKGSNAAYIVTMITTQGIIPSLKGLYNKFVIMLTGDLTVSGQFVALVTNIQKFVFPEKDKKKWVKNIKRLSDDVITSIKPEKLSAVTLKPPMLVNANPETTPEGMEFIYNIPPGSKIVTPSKLNL